MGDLHLPPAHHLLDVVGDVIERHRLREVVARSEMVTNVVRRDLWNDRAIRDLALDCGYDASKVRYRHGPDRIWPLWMRSYSDVSRRTKA